MYAFTSSGSRQSLHALVICAFSAAVLLLTASSIDGVPFAWLFQLAAILLAAVGVYFLAGYVLREYRYEITDSGLVSVDGAPVIDLTVTMVIGRKMQVVSRIALREIGQVQVLDRAAYRKRADEFAAFPHKFRYDNNPFSPVACYITVPGEDALLAIPPDPRMVEILSSAAGAGRS